ncbi:MAG: DNA polymerase III subunit delta [Spirochaetaceae bacterium]|nr:MAG: DNA polymerase III subunit delta [Spirochaetaceae bacterium]
MSKRRNVFLLSGPENGDKKEFIRSLIAGAEKAGGAPPDRHRFYAFETPAREVVALLRNGTLFAPHVLIELHAAEEIKKKDELEALVEYIESPSDAATLVLVTDETESRVSKKIVTAVPPDNKKTFWEMFDNQKAAWVTAYLKRRGARIEAGAAEFLLELVENYTDDLAAECDKLALFFVDGAIITVDDIERYIYHTKEENVFTLFDDIAAGEFSDALEKLQTILLGAGGHPVQILAGIIWQIRRLYDLVELVHANTPVRDAMTKLNIRGKRNQATYSAALKRYDRTAVRGILAAAAECDAFLRTNRPALHAAALHNFVYRTMIRHGEPAATPAP